MIQDLSWQTLPCPWRFPSSLRGREPVPNAITPSPQTFHCLAGLLKRGLALHPEAGVRRHESPGTQIMVLFKLVVHLHPGWTGAQALGLPGSCAGRPPASVPGPAQRAPHPVLPASRWFSGVIRVRQFSYLEDRIPIAPNHPVLFVED